MFLTKKSTITTCAFLLGLAFSLSYGATEELIAEPSLETPALVSEPSKPPIKPSLATRVKKAVSKHRKPLVAALALGSLIVIKRAISSKPPSKLDEKLMVIDLHMFEPDVAYRLWKQVDLPLFTAAYHKAEAHSAPTPKVQDYLRTP